MRVAFTFSTHRFSVSQVHRLLAPHTNGAGAFPRVLLELPLVHQFLHAPPLVPNAPLPILGGLPSGHRLELIRRQPLSSEVHAFPDASPREAVQVEIGLVRPARHHVIHSRCVLRQTTSALFAGAAGGGSAGGIAAIFVSLRVSICNRVLVGCGGLAQLRKRLRHYILQLFVLRHICGPDTDQGENNERVFLIPTFSIRSWSGARSRQWAQPAVAGSRFQCSHDEALDAMDKYSTAVGGDSRFKHVLTDPRFKVNFDLHFHTNLWFWLRSNYLTIEVS